MGTGIDAVHVYIDGEAGQGGRLLGGARYGLTRQDVGSANGGGRFVPSGFTYSWDTLSVAPGSHTLYVYARGAPGGQWSFSTIPVTVTSERRPPQTSAPAGPSSPAPAAAPATSPPTTMRMNLNAGLPAPTRGLPKINDHPTDDNVGQVVNVTPPPRGIRWSEVAAEYDSEENLSVVLLGLLANDRAQAWLNLPPAEQEQFLRQLMVNLGETYLSDDAFLVGVVCRLQVQRKADIPSFVQDRYIKQQADGSYRATWPDVTAGYDVTSGKMIFKSARMTDAGPTLTK